MGCGGYAGVRPKVTCLSVPRIKVGFRCAVPGFEPGLANSRLEVAEARLREYTVRITHTPSLLPVRVPIADSTRHGGDRGGPGL